MEKNYLGMTVNERLFVAGLTNKFDEAVYSNDIENIILILKELELNDESINPILEQLKLRYNPHGC